MFCTNFIVFPINLLHFDHAAAAGTEGSLDWLKESHCFRSRICKRVKRGWCNTAHFGAMNVVLLRSICTLGAFAVSQPNLGLLARIPNSNSTSPRVRVTKQTLCTAVVHLQIGCCIAAATSFAILVVAIQLWWRCRRLAEGWTSTRDTGDTDTQKQCFEEEDHSTSGQHGKSHIGFSKRGLPLSKFANLEQRIKCLTEPKIQFFDVSTGLRYPMLPSCYLTLELSNSHRSHHSNSQKRKGEKCRNPWQGGPFYSIVEGYPAYNFVS